MVTEKRTPHTGRFIEDDPSAFRPVEEYGEMVRRWLATEAKIRADLKAEGIHVGWGNPARCLVCEQPWPCEGSHAH